ncbi:MAG: putative Se/S carrier-like protein [Oscillospiraceae bacterium]
MKRKIIILNSITFAYKARDYLYKNGIKAYVERIPASLRTQGCGYGVRVEGEVKKSVELLKSIGLEVKDVVLI